MTILEIIFLGTSGSIPTNERSLPSIAIRRNGEILLFDAGENCQVQIIKAGLKPGRVTKVFISHLHTDHFLGIFGFLQTMILMERTKSIYIYGPPGLSELLDAFNNIVGGLFNPYYNIFVEKTEGGILCEEREYIVRAIPVSHGKTFSLAFSLEEKPRSGKFFPEKARALGIPEGSLWSRIQNGETLELKNGRTISPSQVMGPERPGRKIVYSGDTRPIQSLIDFSKGADVLIHEATFDDDLHSNAVEAGHSTASEAAIIAREADVKMLVLTHISPRYRDTSKLLKQAKEHFPNVIIAKDLLSINIPLKENFR